MRNVVIAEYLRTAQSRSRPREPERDVFHKLRADDLVAKLLPEILRRAGVDSSEVDDFILGSALGVIEQFTIGGRAPWLLADLDRRTPCKFIDQQCASAMATVHVGAMEIATDNADVVVCAGMEHMTRIPMDGGGAIVNNPRFLEDEALAHLDMKTGFYMGLTAEKLAAQDGITREAMDAWSVRSHNRAEQAQDAGYFKGEILPIDAEQADGTMLTVDRDMAVRKGAVMEGMGDLRTPFKEDGVITPGNASPLNAGAATMMLMAEEEAEKRGVKPLARIKAFSFVGVDPSIMGVGPVDASRKALAKAGLTVDDIDYWEINEAFALVALHAIQELGIEPDRVNVKGGGIAIGHALGATGIRILGTLARTLQEKEARYGCATLCIGGGQGAATIIERI
jgi:acetyl-CoA C-acetyltransferase